MMGGSLVEDDGLLPILAGYTIFGCFSMLDMLTGNAVYAGWLC